MQVKQDATGSPKGNAVVEDGVHDLVERRLDVGERFHAREAGAEDVSAADGTGGILEALLIAVVEVTEFFVFEGG